MHQKHIAQLIATALQCSTDDLLPLNSNLIATLSSEVNPKHWVSVYGNILDFAYTSHQPPHTFAQQIFSELPSWQLVDWSPGRLATVEFDNVELQKLSQAICLFFNAMHETAEYSLTCSAKSFGSA
jgi:hypothetical protein